MPEETLIFEHVPKCGGRTVRSILNRLYASESIFVADDAPERERFRKMPRAERETYNAIIGHGAYKLYDNVPGKKMIFTMIRDPVDRIISSYYYVLRNPSHYLHKVVKNVPLKEYPYIDKNYELKNNYVRRFASVGGKRDQMIVQEDYIEAKRNLENFDIVGILEHFDKSILYAYYKFGWKCPFYVRKNESDKRPEKKDLDKEVIDSIRSANKLDIKIYNLFCDKFEKKIKNSYKIKIHNKIFSITNKFYSQIISNRRNF